MTSNSSGPVPTSIAVARAALDGYFQSLGANSDAAMAWTAIRPLLASAGTRGPGEPNFLGSPSTGTDGLQDVMAGVGELPFPDCLAEWMDKPFARIRWLHLNADDHAKADHIGTWALGAYQDGTVLAELVERYGADFGGAPSAADILADLAGSQWIQDALQGALQRDPVDAANDAAVLARVSNGFAMCSAPLARRDLQDRARARRADREQTLVTLRRHTLRGLVQPASATPSTAETRAGYSSLCRRAFLTRLRPGFFLRQRRVSSAALAHFRETQPPRP